MAPTIQPGNTVEVTEGKPVSRGSIIYFREPTSWGGLPGAKIISRVVAIGGDRVACTESKGLTVNGQPLPTAYRFPTTPPCPYKSTFAVKVPTGGLFVIGDNRKFSGDSRDRLSDNNGAVPTSDVIGVVTKVT